MSHPYIQPLLERFETTRDPQRAARMKSYMKDRSEFYGIQAGPLREMIRSFLKEHGLPEWSETESICRSLWDQPERECQYTAVELLIKMKVYLGPSSLPLLEHLITTKSWWDTVDGIASWLVGTLFKQHPQLAGPTVRQWMDSGNVWLQRTCLLYQLKYKETTDTKRLFDLIRRLADHPSFWIRKAIGWTLREYSKTDPVAVRQFIENHSLSPLSRREALKVIERQRRKRP